MADHLTNGNETEIYAPPGNPPANPASAAGVRGSDEGRFVPGTLLGGRYRIIGLIGQGGMGEVYRATDLMLGQSVALKFLLETAVGNASLLERFHGEVRVARQISHPNVCRVYDIGEMGGLPFISMEYVDGEDLSILLQRIGRLPTDKALEVAREVCIGLAAAHRKGVIHRDLKPQNIMMNRRGEIIIMDFGLAAISKQLSGAEVLNGTPVYMSPEQLKGTEVTAKSDIYALGLVLYELFTGRKPFTAGTVTDWIAQQEDCQYPSIASIASGTDPEVDRTIRLCLDPDPAKRPETPLEVMRAFPGCDPLSAAVAAGKTLSPDAVARFGQTGGLALKYSIPCLAMVVLCLLAAPALKREKISLYQAQDDYPPAALRQRARDFAFSAGYVRRPADSAAQLNQRFELLNYLPGLPGEKQWKKWLAAESPISQTYRESLAPLVALPTGIVTASNPPLDQPGMVEVELDGQARLRGFSAVPYDSQAGDGAIPTPDLVFHAAQLEITDFVEYPPTPGFRHPWSDQLRTWKGKHPVIPNTDLIVEMATWKGQLTAVKITWPWMTAQSSSVAPSFVARYRGDMLTIATCLGLILAGLMAIRNWKIGRSDPRGAFRIAIVRCLLGIGTWIGTAHLVPHDTYPLFLGALSDGLLSAAILFVLYISLEPALRLRWPHSIVTWNRAVAGMWRDPQVSAHILIGTALGATMWTFGQVHDVLAGSGEGLDTVGGLFLLNGTRAWAAGILARASRGLETGLEILFLVFIVRTLLRKDWIAATVGALLYAAVQPDLLHALHWKVEFVVYALMFGMLIFALLRFGLVVAVMASFIQETLGSVTLGTDFMAWYVPTGLATGAVILIIALIAFHQSMGNGRGETFVSTPGSRLNNF